MAQKRKKPVVCTVCGNKAVTYLSKSKGYRVIGTDISMRCEDCGGEDGRATRCRECCPTGHGTKPSN